MSSTKTLEGLASGCLNLKFVASWSQLEGGKKVFSSSTNVSITWRKNKNSLIVKGEGAINILKELLDIYATMTIAFAAPIFDKTKTKCSSTTSSKLPRQQPETKMDSDEDVSLEFNVNGIKLKKFLFPGSLPQ